MPERAPTLRFAAVTRATADDFVQLFDAPGGPKYCWCMAWRVTRDEAASHPDGKTRKPLMLQRIADGIPVGLLAYEDNTPVGWVSVAPRTTYRDLGGPPAREGETIWSLACLYVPRAKRASGYGKALVGAAIAHARAQGATVLEAYPVDPDSPSYRFMGFLPVFATLGFQEVGRAGSRRHVVRLALAR